MLSCGLAGIIPSEEQKANDSSGKKVGEPSACAPVLLSKPRLEWPKTVQYRKNESYKRAPIISFEIEESGKVSNVKVTRGSGVRDIDAWVVNEIKRWKYKPGPGCGIRETDATVIIDFRLEESTTPSE
jgi:TonB family protein